MRIYETMFIIDPNLEDAERDELANRVKSWIEEKVKGEVRSFDRWGIRQLAFRVDKFMQGDYTVIVFNAEPHSVKALEDMYRITPRIFRWMVFRREDLEKHAGEEKEEKEEASENEESLNTENEKVETTEVAQEVEEAPEDPSSSDSENLEKDEGENS